MSQMRKYVNLHIPPEVEVHSTSSGIQTVSFHAVSSTSVATYTLDSTGVYLALLKFLLRASFFTFSDGLIDQAT